MVKYENHSDQLSKTFAALADPTRRAILSQLSRGGGTTVTELAKPFAISMPAITKHLKVLEKAGLVERSRQAQWRPSAINAGPLKEAAGWINQYRQIWENSLDRLDAHLKKIQKRENKND